MDIYKRQFILTLLIIFFNISFEDKVIEEDNEAILKEIKKGLSDLNITNKDSINQKEFVKLFKYLINENYNKEGMPSSNIEDNFMFKVIRQILEGVPEIIKIEDIPKYLNPKKIETIFNNLLGNMNFDKLLSDIGNEIDNSVEEIKKKNEEYNNKKEKEDYSKIEL
jgi:hypothetical protein